MQYHVDGYRTGDPRVLPEAPGAYREGSDLPDQVDVLIVGTGPAGSVLGAQLAAFPDITTRIIERREGPLAAGRADGVACRTVEMFQAFGLATTMIDEAYWVNESVFWGPDEAEPNRLVRTGRVRDVEDGLSEMPHLIVNQARLQDHLLDFMRRSPTRLEPDYGVEFLDLRIDEGEDFPVAVTVLRDGVEARLRARYVVGCDGARSRVRASIGRELHGDSANHAWGVLDVLAVSDFPDWRLKSVIRSAEEGNILLIPREGGNMVRLYVDLGEVRDRDDLGRFDREYVIAAAQRVLRPFTVDVREVAWFSVYEVGQRLADRFDDGSEHPRVFIAGDACHTHSAKAGQGMNVSMQDGFNLGWKLAAVLGGRSDPALLRSYSDERQAIAQDLIDFDRAFSTTIARAPFDAAHPERGGVTAQEMQRVFVEAGRYTAGVATRYRPSALTGGSEHQHLAAGFTIGMRFHSARVVRIADARELHLGHVHEADGRWRLYLFADAAGERMEAALAALADTVLPRFTPEGADIDSVLDVRGIYPMPYAELDIMRLPPLLRPARGRLGLRDYEKAFAVGPREDVFAARGVGPTGAMVLVRPDQYVAHVLPLGATDELATFLDGVLRG